MIIITIVGNFQISRCNFLKAEIPFLAKSRRRSFFFIFTGISLILWKISGIFSYFQIFLPEVGVEKFFHRHNHLSYQHNCHRHRHHYHHHLRHHCNAIIIIVIIIVIINNKMRRHVLYYIMSAVSDFTVCCVDVLANKTN